MPQYGPVYDRIRPVFCVQGSHGNPWTFSRVLMIHLVRTTIDIHLEGVLDSVTVVHCFLTLIL